MTTLSELPITGAAAHSLEHENAVASVQLAPHIASDAPCGTKQTSVAMMRSPKQDDRVDESTEDRAAVLTAQHNMEVAVDSASSAQSDPDPRQSTHGEEQAPRYSTYSNPPNISNNDEDLDPAALLESLASFDHTQAHGVNGQYSSEQDGHHYHPHQTNQFENDHFASLLQAAATAGQNQENDHHSHYENHSTRESQPLQEWNAHGINAQQSQRAVQKRKHSRLSHDATSTPNTDTSSQWDSRNARRKLTTEAADAALAREHEIWGPSDHSDGEEPSTSYAPLSPSSARAAGVHSAAALFRKPTPASKKYTRPPMSKLFTSLEISPEQFLHLQAAAKSYMLDPAHPDRYNCVGSRAKVDTDMVKLKLFGCVETFLEEEGWGVRCWGANAEREVPGQANNWRLRWPESRNKIITSVTPLMRRMVTNERQRRYAIETRSREKGGKTTKPSQPPSDNLEHQGSGQLPPEIDPKLGDYHYTLASPNADNTALETTSEQHRTPQTTTFRLVILSPTHTQQVVHSTAMTLPTHNSYHNIVQHIRSWLAKSEIAKSVPGGLDIAVLSVHLPNGLQEINMVEDWDEAVKLVQQTVWMEGTLRVVVELGTEDDMEKQGVE